MLGCVSDFLSNFFKFLESTLGSIYCGSERALLIYNEFQGNVFICCGSCGCFNSFELDGEILVFCFSYLWEEFYVRMLEGLLHGLYCGAIWQQI
jgi:hypothetical protein